MSNQTISLNLEERTVTGKAVRHLRKSGIVPGVVYESGHESKNIQADYLEITKAYREAGRNHPVNLQVAGKKHLAMIKSVDYEPAKRRIRHISFHAIKQNEKVTAEVPIRIRLDEGNDVTPAERAGLVVLSTLEAVEVKALPRELPDALEYDGEKLVEVGDHATLADLIIPEGVELEATDLTQGIASVYEPSALQAANDAAGGDAEPEDVEDVEAENGAEPGESEANLAESINKGKDKLDTGKE